MAVIDVKLRDELVWSIADKLVKENIPFVFVTGYSASALPARFRSIKRWEKPCDMKADLRLTPEQEKNWRAFETAVVDMWKKRTEARIAWRTANAKQQGSTDLIDEMRKDADRQIDEANAWKKLADAAQPIYSGLDDQQKQRFADALSRRDRDRHAY